MIPDSQYKTGMKNDARYLLSGQNWLPHAEFELSYEALIGKELRSWLSANLRPLGLVEPFIEKLYHSARDTVGDIPSGIDHVRVLIYKPANLTPVDQTWGFFRMVKNGGIHEEPPVNQYEIVFYLYAEGSARLE